MSDSSRSCRPHAAFVGWLPLAALLCALLAPLAVAADAPGSKAEQLQQQVAAIDARTKSQAPLRERPLQGFAAEGARVVSWGTTGAIEKISVEGLGERGRTFLDFYWQGGQLVVAHARRAYVYRAQVFDRTRRACYKVHDPEHRPGVVSPRVV